MAETTEHLIVLDKENQNIAVIISRNYGSGLYTWYGDKSPTCHIDATAVMLVQNLQEARETEGINKLLPAIKKSIIWHYKEWHNIDLNESQVDDLEVEWVPISRLFKFIKEHDGQEYID
jgi:hypothetical protein